jgi:ribosomal protein L11 methyltransferase
LKWFEIRLDVDGEQAEAVSELFARYIPHGVASEWHPVGEPEHRQQHPPTVTIRAFLPVDTEFPSLRQRIEEGLWHLSQILPLPQPSSSFVEERDWAETWKEHFQPIPIGERLLIAPPWVELPPSERTPIWIDPGMAFGTGLHPSTRLCLLALERHLESGHTVLDLGCGSGILSIAASRLGAAHVTAYDIDPEAIQAAQGNVTRNNLAQRITVKLGSLDHALAARAGGAPPVDILVANILASTLQQLLAGGLAQILRPGGLMILSGLLSDQHEDLAALAQQDGLMLLEVLQEGDWRALLLRTAGSEMRG